jgi:predicted nucleic acid-binding protein
LRTAEITLIEAITSQQVVTEVERNLRTKMPKALPAFQLLVSRCLQVVTDPKPSDVQAYVGLADEKDLPILVTAVQQNCPWLVTFNIRHFQPGHPEVTVLQPGDFLQHVRHMLANL